MAFTVHLKPSDHEFIVAKGETILEAALRYGLSVHCSCTNGTCGKCRARVISGDTGDVQHFDYVMSHADKNSNTILMCRTTVASDMVIEASEAKEVCDIARQQLTATVYTLEKITDDVMIVELRTPRSQTLEFMAGQHATIKIDGIEPRNRSIASCPCNGMILQLHIHNTPGDKFSEYVFSDLKLRQLVAVEGPFGEFVLDEESIRPIIFIAYGIGFAPIKSIIEHAIALEFDQPMRLYWIVDQAREHYQENFCRSWQDALDDFQFMPIFSADELPEFDESLNLKCDWAEMSSAEKGLLQAAIAVVAEYPDLSEYDVYINGPLQETRAASQILIQHNISQDHLFIDQLERF